MRRARVDDVEQILALIRELADYEREPDAVRATPDDLRRDGFGPDPAFEALLAEVEGEGVVGLALYFGNYSTWEGRRGIYLEDLYVRPAARRRGVGRALLAALAAEVRRRGGARLDLSVLDWNQPARDVYAALGFEHKHDWRPYRLEGAALERLAAEGGARGPS
ncbi:MAG: N-acetyltransferase family protein [Planctomycetota bacterium]